MKQLPYRHSVCTTPFVALLIASSGVVFAQEAKASVEDELLALLNTPITVASQKAMTTRESPGIVTLVTRDEILASGARDLLDVLQMVPGFSFASDVQGVVGPAVRGNWGYEGKTLLLFDGQEMNEIRYGTLQFGNHYPIEQIKRIEIIRGPGSAIYGGFAELAVINVVTRDGIDLRGVSGALNYGQAPGSITQRTANLAYGNNWNGVDFAISYSGGGGHGGNRSDRMWQASDFTLRDLKENSSLNQSFLDLGLKWKGASFRFLYDDYNLTDFTQFPTVYNLVPPQKIEFGGKYLDFKYDWELAKTFKLVPRLTWKSQQPWFYPTGEATRKREATRSTLGLQAIYDPMPSLDLVFGGSLSEDEGKAVATDLWNNGDTTVKYTNRVLYGQALWTSDIVNVTLGARYGRNSQFGSNFVPRMAVTKAWDIFHVKFLWSRAFRSPVIENFELNPKVRPEKTRSMEVEFGAQVTPKVFVSMNFFDIKITDPIVYSYDSATDIESYSNYVQSGTRGFELDLQIRGDWGYLHATMSTSQVNQNEVPDYTVPEQDKYMVGLPNTKATLLASFKITENLSFAPSLISYGPRYTYEAAGGPVLRESSSLFNVMLHYRFPSVPLFLSIGAHNVTYANVGFPKAYIGTDGDTYPSQGRDIFIRLGYNF